MAFIRGGVQTITRFIVSLPVEPGPLAVPRDSFDFSPMTWSPVGLAYVLEGLVFDAQGGMHGRENLFPLCPNAVQDIEVCGAPIHLGEQIEWLEWVDRDRFLYVTYQPPRRLYLGSLDGSATMLAEDPLSFAAIASTCQDDSEFVSDVTVPDGTPFTSSTPFLKTWRLRNIGSCAWDTSYRLAYVTGERLSGPHSQPLGETIPPGGEIELSLNLIAPADPGRYQGEWQLLDPNGAPFGIRAPADIVVPSFTVTEFTPEQLVAKIPAEPGQLALGEGAHWLLSGDAVSRIDLDTNQLVASIPVGEFRVDIAIGYGVVRAAANVIIHRSDPQTDQVSATIQPAPSLGLNGIAAGAGSVWVSSAGDGTIYRIDPGTNQVIAAIQVDLATQQIAVWVTSLKLNRTDDGALITSPGAPGLMRIDPTTNGVSAGIPLDCGARNIVVDDLAVWVPCDIAPVVYRIDPQTNQVLARIAIPGRPRKIASDLNAVWVTTGNMLTRIDPATTQVTAMARHGRTVATRQSQSHRGFKLPS